MVLRGTLLGGTDLQFIDVAFSRNGARVAAFGNRTDHLATVWNLKKDSADDEELTGEKVRYLSLSLPLHAQLDGLVSIISGHGITPRYRKRPLFQRICSKHDYLQQRLMV